MGCCASRSDFIQINREKLITFITSQKLNSLSCEEIRKLTKKPLDKPSFESYAPQHKISIPFEVLEINNIVYPLELKVALLLFNNDSLEQKEKLLGKIVKTDRQKLRFFEWRFQLLNERLPKYMHKKKEIDSNEEVVWLDHYRLRSAAEIIQSWKLVKEDPFRPSLELMTVN